MSLNQNESRDKNFEVQWLSFIIRVRRVNIFKIIIICCLKKCLWANLEITFQDWLWHIVGPDFIGGMRSGSFFLLFYFRSFFVSSCKSVCCCFFFNFSFSCLNCFLLCLSLNVKFSNQSICLSFNFIFFCFSFFICRNSFGNNFLFQYGWKFWKWKSENFCFFPF